MSDGGFLSRLKRSRPAPEEREEPPLLPRKRAASGASTQASGAVEQARRQARQRLIGAGVLLTVGVVAFPVVFETQPRPAVAPDLPMRIAHAPQAAQTQALSPGTAPSSTPGTDAKDPATGAANATEPVLEPVPGAAALPAAQPAHLAQDALRSTTAGSGSATSSGDGPAADLPLDPAAKRMPAPGMAPAPSLASAATNAQATPGLASAPRFIVQIGAFADAGAVRNLRARIERLGLTSYTQAVDTTAGRRIRVRLGPYDSREEATRALEKLQQSGLSGGMVLTL